jgi:5'-3' exonuclease
VQVDRKSKTIRDADGVRAKFGVSPILIPDFLALAGDGADGYPGIAGIGPKSAARLLGRYGPIEDFPPEVLRERRDLALLFKKLALLRTDKPLLATSTSLIGPKETFSTYCECFAAPQLLTRANKAAASKADHS